MGDRRHRRNHDTGTPPLALEVRSRLRADDPLELLTYASALVETAAHGSGDDVDLALLVETLTVVDSLEASALLAAVSHLLAPGDLRAGARRALMRRHPPLPSWLRELDHTEVTDAAVITGRSTVEHTVVLGIRWPGGQSATAVVDIDDQRDVGVRDAWVTSEPWTVVLSDLAGLWDSTRSRLVDVVGLDVARAALDLAVERPGPPHHSFASDTWPANRPMVRWLLDRMPPPDLTE